MKIRLAKLSLNQRLAALALFLGVVALFAEVSSIRDVIAFPKSAAGTDLMLDTPSRVSETQLKELHIMLRP